MTTHLMEDVEELQEFLLEIKKWEEAIISNSDLIDLAFFKIFVKFEKLLLDSIINYAIGNKSSKDYIPNRKLQFQDFEHLRKTVTDKQYIDVSNRLGQLCDQLFEENNPFTFFFNSSDQQEYKCMQAIRNYIAHESPESHEKFKKIVLNNKDKSLTPNDFLLLQKSRGSTYFNSYIEMLKNYAILFVSPQE